jgi:multicomponent K+:H+ antiporter subunit E
VTKVLPHPVLTLAIAGVWVALINSISLGSVLFGLVLGIAIPLFTSPYSPVRPTIRNPLRLLEYIAVVGWDIVVSNIQVAYWVLFLPSRSLRTQFVVVPLDLASPEAQAEAKRNQERFKVQHAANLQHLAEVQRKRREAAERWW